MADINLTPGDDRYTQPESQRDEWNTIFGLEGNDVIRLYQGGAVGGPGNDTLERIVTADWWRTADLAFWDSPAGIRVDFETGIAEDGWGGRDTLIGSFRTVHGNGHDDWFKGNADDNFFWGNGGHDTFFGGGGQDGVGIGWFEPAPGEPWRPPRLDELAIQVSVDGREASVAPKTGKGFRYTLTDVEYVQLDVDGEWAQISLADFVTQVSMAEQAIAAGGSQRWNAASALGTPAALTYSFVTQPPASGVGAPGFRAFTAAEQQLVRDLLARTAAFCGLSFSEVTESAGSVGQLRFGVSQQRDTRGVSWLPNQSGAGDQAGDVWMDAESMSGIAPGSEGYAALLHEIGHALGLRHPRNVDPGDAWAVQLREVDDRSALTVMSDTYSADGLFRSDWGPLDVLALRHLYGTRSVGSGDSTWTLGARESLGQTTLIDDGGVDTLDASGLGSGVSVVLEEGKLSNVGVTAAGFNGVENLGLPMGTVIEHAIGSPFDDVLVGNALDNRLTGGDGNDWIDGGQGRDTATYAGARADYELSAAYGKVYVRARDGVSGYDTLVGIETLAFADEAVALQEQALGADVVAQIDEDQVLTLTLPDASDLARSQTTYTLLAAPGHGRATLGADGRLVYTPEPDYWGRDAIPFEISGNGGSNRYRVFVDVKPVNDAAPVGQDAKFLAGTGAVLKARLPVGRDADGDPLSYLVSTAPRGGTVTIDADGVFYYQSRAGTSGSDSFEYALSDGNGGSSRWNVTVNLHNVTGQRMGTAGRDTLEATTAAEAYSALEGDDTITGGEGDDLIDGGAGLDTALYTSANRSRYRLERADTHWLHTDRGGGDGVDRLVDVERVVYSTSRVALDLDGHAGIVAQVIRCVLGAAALKTREYVGIGLQLVDAGTSLEELVALALSTPQFEALAGSRSNRDVVDQLYTHVAGKAPSAAELDGLTALLDSGAFTQQSLAVLACTHAWNTGSADLVGLAATGIEYVFVPGYG